MIRSDRLTDTFLTLTGFSAESYHERKIADYVKHRLTDLGLTVTEDDIAEQLAEKGGVDPSETSGNLYAVLPGNVPGDPVLLSGHLDTVKPGVAKKAILHEDGTITSDGTTVLGADDVSALSEILEVLTVIVEKDLPHPEIEVLICPAEEPYAQGSRLFDYSVIRAKEAYVFDMSGPVGPAAVAAPSILTFTVHIQGRSAHAGFAPEAGVHAIAIAGEALSNIKNGHIDDVTTVNIGTISGGVLPNVVPESVTLGGEIRSLNDDTAEEQFALLQKAFLEAAESYGGSVTFDYTKQITAYRIEEDEPVVQRYKRAGVRAGVETSFRTTFGGSDNNNFTLHGIRGIVAACAMNKSHSTEEYTTVEELTKAARLMLALVTEEE